MSNLEKYNNAFVEIFGVDLEALNDDFAKQNVAMWDSVHQLGLVTAIEDEFDVMFDPEDIMAMTSYAAGKALLAKYDVEL